MFLLCLLGITWILNVSIPGSQPQGCFLGCASIPPMQGDELRVLSLNVLHDRPNYESLEQRLERIGTEIRKLGADIVLLQEVPWILGLGNGAEFIAKQAKMNYVFARANGNKWTIFFEEGEAILSHYPLKKPTVFELNPLAGFFEHRIVLHSVVETSHGELDLYVSHLTNKDKKINREQANSLKTFVEESTSGVGIIGGDFNAKDDEPQIVNLSRVWLDSYRELNPTEDGLTCCIEDLTSAPGENLEKRIDYIFFARSEEVGFKLLDAHVVLDQPIHMEDGWLWASDHLGVLVSFYLDK